MPVRPKQPCAEYGCPVLVESGRCRAHRPLPFLGVRNRPNARQRGYTSEWERERRRFLRENPACVVCGGPATVVDHITPHRGDPALFWAESNWQPMCAADHAAKTAREASSYGRERRHSAVHSTQFAIPVTVVCGPPGSGKSRYVEERRKWGDLTVDMDALYQAVSGLPVYEKPDALLPFVAEARDALVERLARTSEVRHAWVLMGGAKREDRQRFANRGAEVVVLATEANECVRRISQDPRRRDKWPLWVSLVRDWWARYERDGA